MINEKSYQPVQSLTIIANEDLPAFRFVGYDGFLCHDGTRALGVTEVDWIRGEYVSVVSVGTIVIETVDDIKAGNDIASAEFGRARCAKSGEIVNGRSLDDVVGNGNGFVRIKIIP